VRETLIFSRSYNNHAWICKETMPFDVSLRFPAESFFTHLAGVQPALSSISVDRVLTTTDQTHGTLHVRVTNNLDRAQDVGYSEMLPWLIMPYLHTLTITIEGSIARMFPLHANSMALCLQSNPAQALTLLSYVPTQDSRPTTLETRLHLPPRSVLRLTMDVDKRFLKYTEHPPDAQRGWDLPGAIFILSDPTSAVTNINHTRLYMHTRPLLIDLATPDFSMPYNVGMMTGTFLGVLFLSVLNMLLREFKVVDMDASIGNENAAKEKTS
jgi:phosphatidylinositol glycan class T